MVAFSDIMIPRHGASSRRHALTTLGDSVDALRESARRSLSKVAANKGGSAPQARIMIAIFSQLKRACGFCKRALRRQATALRVARGIFGPLSLVLSFREEREALAGANDCPTARGTKKSPSQKGAGHVRNCMLSLVAAGVLRIQQVKNL